MVKAIISEDIAAGKKANSKLIFQTKGLKDCGIEKIANMELYFYIFDSTTWDEIVSTETISIDTSIAGSYVQEVDDTGEVLVDTNDIKIVAKGLSEDGSFFGPGLILYIENNSDENITIQARDVSINGFMVTSTISEEVVAGKKSMCAVQFFSSDLEKNGITEINEVELYFHIFNQETWDAIFDSDIQNIKF